MVIELAKEPSNAKKRLNLKLDLHMSRIGMPIHKDTAGENYSGAPQLYVGEKIEHRLIDDGLMFLEASRAGYKERHSRGETSHTLQVWWARRPHSAMRALIFASLCKTTNPRTLNLLSSLATSNNGDSYVLSECEKVLLEQYNSRPKILDMFGGGGTIPLEASNLGANVDAIDINELSVFVHRYFLELLPPKELLQIKHAVKESGMSVLARLKSATDILYPLRYSKICEGTNPGPITYLWSYTTSCKSCGYIFFLMKRPWLSRKKGKNILLARIKKASRETIAISNNSGKFHGNKARGTSFICPRCGYEHNQISIKDCRDEVVALVLKNEGTGKRFVVENGAACPSEKVISDFEADYLRKSEIQLPESLLPKWSGIVNPSLYGIDTHSDFLNRRQRAVLVALIAELLHEYKHLLNKRTEIEAKFIISALSGLIDQMIDWNCRLSMWIPQNEQVGRAFCGPGVAMLWDYAEADPLLNGPANLWKKLDRIIDGLDSLVHRRGKISVRLASARKLPFPSNSFDAIVTDPPYYDNIYYNVLADFFFAWKRQLLRNVDEDLFSASVTVNGGQEELVASSIRSGDAKNAHLDYCTKLSEALEEASRVLKNNGVLVFIYSHASLGGWAALVFAFRKAHLIITSAQPLSIERKARPRAIGSVAVNTCIAFVARKYLQEKRPVQIDKIMSDFKKIIDSDFVCGLLNAGWNSADAGVALYAQGVSLLASYSEVIGFADEEVLEMMELEVKSRVPEFKVKKRASL